MDDWEKAFRDSVKQKHPDFKQEKDGKPVPLEEMPTDYLEEYIKEKNPNAVLKINGRSIKELGEILDRNLDKLKKIKGFRGYGVGKDGIEIFIDKDHDKFPTDLEGVPIEITPTDRKGMNLSARRKG